MNHFVTQTGAGLMDGSTVENAWSVSQLNDVAFWAAVATPGFIGPGSVVWLEGNIVDNIAFKRSGTLEAPITIAFAPGATMSKEAWQGAIIDIANKSHLIVDGKGVGIMESTNNGSPLNFPTSYYAVGVSGANLTTTTNITVRGLTIRNLYQRTDKTGGGSGYGVRFGALSSGTFSNILVENCTIHDMEEGVGIGFRPNATNNVIIRNNTIFNVDDGVSVGSGDVNAVLSGLQIYGNRIYDFEKWDGEGHNDFHHDGIHLFTAQSGSRIENVEIHDNIIGSGFGSKATSGIYFSGHCYGVKVYNNVLIGNPNTPANGLLTIKTWPGRESFIYNNTFIGNGNSGTAIYLNGGDSAGGTVTIKNNVAIGITFIYMTTYSRWTLTSDRNLGFQLRTGYNFGYTATQTGSFRTYTQWQALGYDANSLFTEDPLLDANYRPAVGSPVDENGENLYSVFTVDADGNARHATEPWDIGAYNAPGPGDPGPGPSEPASNSRGRKRRGARLFAFL